MRLLALALFLPSAMAFAKVHHVDIRDVKFQPADLEVTVGDTIEWVNQDLVPHTVTAEDKTFDSKQVDPGKKFKTKLSKPGTIKYKCMFHPNMLGKIVIKSRSAK